MTCTYDAILSDDYRGILDVAVVGPAFGVDGRADYGFFFDEEPEGKRVVWQEDGYLIADADYDSPTLILFHGGRPCGFYFDMMAWLDPDHRGRGLATRMVLSYASHFGADAFAEQRRKAGCGLGFSQEGYDLHIRVLEIAEEKRSVNTYPALSRRGVLK